ncbi:MAG: type II secretion system F family protein [Acidimicrobiia bacterium]|nr:type II secretion system F family protein [Acidimicrobiia bacterium]
MNPVALLAGLGVISCAAAARRAGRSSHSSRVLRRFGTANASARTPSLPGLRLPSWLPAALTNAEIPLTPDRAWALWITSTVVGACAGAVLGGPALAVGCAALAGAAPLFVLRARRGAADAKTESALPGALEAVARGLRSGGSLRQAVAEAATATPGALGGEMRLAAEAAERGTPLVDALEAWAERCPQAGVRLAVGPLRLGAETGGAQARAIDGVAATLRERLAVAGEVRALTSQTRASMLVIAAAPLVFCVFASSTDPRTSAFLFRSPVGLACLAAGISLDIVGAFWMRRLCRVTA